MVQHLLAIDDVNDDFERILKWAIEFKRLWKQGDEVALNFLPLDTLAIGSIYEKPSTRTRVSFEVGIQRLGGSALTLLKNDIQLGTSETIGDTAQVLSRFLGGITYRCFGHEDVAALAEHAEVPVINALSDKYHPLQILADLLTLREHYAERPGGLRGLKVAWVGDGNAAAGAIEAFGAFACASATCDTNRLALDSLYANELTNATVHGLGRLRFGYCELVENADDRRAFARHGPTASELESLAGDRNDPHEAHRVFCCHMLVAFRRMRPLLERGSGPRHR